jgi:hypothetical protein
MRLRTEPHNNGRLVLGLVGHSRISDVPGDILIGLRLDGYMAGPNTGETVRSRSNMAVSEGDSGCLPPERKHEFC